jgi:hypothetical protein
MTDILYKFWNNLHPLFKLLFTLLCLFLIMWGTVYLTISIAGFRNYHH